jgi:hypothetical protein
MERAIANLSLNTLIRECSKNPQEARNHYGYFDAINREREQLRYTNRFICTTFGS